MPAAIDRTNVNLRQWFAITLGIIATTGGLFLALTAMTAYATRSAIYTRFNASNHQNQIVKLNNLDGGINWSHCKLGVGVTAIEIDTQMQHWGVTTYIQGQILDTKLSSTPLATFTGNSLLWMQKLYWNLSLYGSGGKWRLPIGYIESNPIDLNLIGHNSLQTRDFDLHANLHELHYIGFPVFHATDVALKAIGALISKNNQLPQWDTMLNLTSDSNYGPLRFEANLLMPNNELSAFWRTAHMQLRAILPMGLWRLIQQWYPIPVYGLKNKAAIKPQTDVAIIDVTVDNGNWQISVAN